MGRNSETAPSDNIRGSLRSGLGPAEVAMTPPIVDLRWDGTAREQIDMPIFYFDIYDNGQLSRDDHGFDLETVGEARAQAIALLPNLARDELPDGEHHSFVCVVRDAGDAPLYRASLTFEGRWGAVGTEPEAEASSAG